MIKSLSFTLKSNEMYGIKMNRHKESYNTIVDISNIMCIITIQVYKLHGYKNSYHPGDISSNFLITSVPYNILALISDNK